MQGENQPTTERQEQCLAQARALLAEVFEAFVVVVDTTANGEDTASVHSAVWGGGWCRALGMVVAAKHKILHGAESDEDTDDD